MSHKSDQELKEKVFGDEDQIKNFLRGLAQNDFMVYSSEEPRSINSLVLEFRDKYYYFKIPKDFAVCWKCWILSTSRGLDRYKREYSRYYEHPEDSKYDTCPLCKYSHWVGSGWYPGKYFEDRSNINPSRIGKENE